MAMFIFAIAGCSSLVVLIVVLALCAKKKTFTIEHDYDRSAPSFVTSSGPSAYRTRNNVYRGSSAKTVHGNGYSVSDGSDQVDGSATAVKGQDAPRDVNGNRKAQVNIVDETPDGRGQQKDEVTETNKVSVQMKVSTDAKEIQRVTSKRKAPLLPTPQSQVTVITTAAHSDLPAKVEAATPTSKEVGISDKAITSPSKTSSTVKGAPRNDSHKSPKKHAPTPPISQVSSTKQHSTETTSLPRRAKSETPRTSSDQKSSTLPGRSSHKRRAPGTPGDGSTVKAPDTTNAGANSLQRTSGKPPQLRVDDDRQSQQHRNQSRRAIMDRLPSIPSPTEDIPPVVVQPDILQDKSRADDEGVSEDDPYAVIKQRAVDETDGEYAGTATKTPSVSQTDVKGDDQMEPPYMRIKRESESEADPKSHSQDNEVFKEPPETRDMEIENSSVDVDVNGEKNALEVGNVIIVPVGSPIGDPQTNTKPEPPYAKVIKKNRRNRGNVRVRFTTEDPTEIPRKKPPTPGALSALNNGNADIMSDSQNRPDVSSAESASKLLEGPSYI